MYSTPDHINFIKSQTVESIVNSKQDIHCIIEIPITATVEEVFDILLAENILSVPVYRLWRGHKQPIAIINVLDLVTFIQPMFDKEDDKSDDSKSVLLQKPIGELIGLTLESTNLTILHPDDSLVDLLDLFTRRQIHRVLVADKRPTEDLDAGKVINADEVQLCFISQTDVVKFLFKHNHILGKILDTLAADVSNRANKFSGSLSSERQYLLFRPSSITIHDQALTAFRKIHHDGVSAVAVVNDDGTLVGEVSAADLRGLNKERLSDLRKPVIAFLRSCRGALIKPLTCHRKFTLSQVMAGIIRGGTHRAWVVDENDVPIGVITLSDILAMFHPDVGDEGP